MDEALKDLHSDLLFSARMGEAQVYLYLLLEHQSTVDTRMAYRMLRYIVRIIDRYLDNHPKSPSLPAVLPVVLYHGDKAWDAAREVRDLFDFPQGMMENHLPKLEFILDDLSVVSDEVLASRSLDVFVSLTLRGLSTMRASAEPLMVFKQWLGFGCKSCSKLPNGSWCVCGLWWSTWLRLPTLIERS